MNALGHLALMVALVVATFAAVASIVGRVRGMPRLQQAGYAAAFAVTGLITVAALSLIYLLVARDFGVKYVQHYSDRSMPLFYVITSFWGGQDGSLLFWVWVLSMYSAAALWVNRSHARLIPWATATTMTIATFFLVVLLFAANPFETYLGIAPIDGKGLNPLLQNYYMSIHPPMLYLGYIGMAIPFAFGIGALASGQTDETWLRISRRWTLLAWFFLSIGLILGQLWAYEELGWGGYWAWDPVENAGFLPWLTCTAFLHSIMIQERRGMFKKWNMSLVIGSFGLTILGTFLTRSGVVQSVHAFAQSNIGIYFITFLTLAMVTAFSLMAWRWKDLSSPVKLESRLSREFAFLLNNWILVGMAFFILTATLFPSLSNWLLGEKITVGPPFYNKWMVPLGLGLLFLTGVGPLIGWRKASGSSLKKQFMWPVSSAITVGGLSMLLGALKGGPATVITYTLAGFVVATVTQEYVRGALVRMKNTGEGLLEALAGLMSRAKRRYGGYVIHFGVVLMFFGWAGNAYKMEKDVTLARGEVAHIGSYAIRYDDLRFGETPSHGEVTAVLSVLGKGGADLGKLEPAKFMYRKSQQPTTEVSIRSTLTQDLYLILAGWDQANGNVTLRLVINPFTMWVWMGAGFLLVGMVVVMWPDRHKRKHLGSGRGVVAGLAFLLLAGSLGFGHAALARPATDIPLPPALDTVAKQMEHKLMCTCGCGEMLSECTCGTSKEMRDTIRTDLKQGMDEKAILAWFVKKDGTQVLSTPPKTTFNDMAWAVPYTILGASMVGLLFVGGRWAKKRHADERPADMIAPDINLSRSEEAAYRERLDDELEDLD